MDEEQDGREQSSMERVGLAVEMAVLLVLTRRLGKLDASTTYAVARALEAQDMAEVGRLLASGSKLVTEHAAGVIDGVAEACDEWAAPYYSAAGATQNKASVDVFLSQQVSAAKAAAQNGIEHVCDSTVIQLYTNDGRLVPFRQAYRSYVDETIRALQRGQADYYTAVEGAVRAISRSGLRVRYEGGSTRELYSAIAQNVMDGAYDAQRSIREEQGRQFGADGIEVSAHSTCAPDHLECQGRQYTKAKFEELQNSLRRPIGKWNCRHVASPIILGVSARTYSAEELRRLRERSAGLTKFEDRPGHRLTRYEFTQWQRQQETSIRKLKSTAALMDSAGVEGGDALRRKAEAKLARYKDVSARVGIDPRVERTKVYDWEL